MLCALKCIAGGGLIKTGIMYVYETGNKVRFIYNLLEVVVYQIACCRVKGRDAPYFCNSI